jgi:hypothetical protein
MIYQITRRNVPNNKFFKLILTIILLFAVPFFLMVYAFRCERLRLSAQKCMIERLIEEQRMARMQQYELNCEDENE